MVKNPPVGISLVVQWLRLQAANARGLGSMLGKGIKSHMLQLKTWCSQKKKESTCNAGDLGSVPGLGRSPREGDGNPFRYSGLENSMGYTVHGVAKSRIRMSNFHFLGIQDTFMINLHSDSTDISNLNSVVLKVQSASHGCYWSTANV